MAFAQIYVCPIHGQTWKPVVVQIIDTDRDDVWDEYQCPDPQCNHSVTPLMHHGKYVMHALTEDELRDEILFSGEEYKGEEDDEYL